MEAYQIIVEPVLTEKTNAQRDGEIKKYTFKVHNKANKRQVMSAVEELFSVKPVSCNILNVKEKPRSTRSKSGFRSGSTSAWKKAIVTLRTGDKIDAIEGV